jgi:isopenicillin N synthase-like dioxygenase
MSATPIPGTIVVNIGDLMQRWTADKLKATVRYYQFTDIVNY